MQDKNTRPAIGARSTFPLGTKNRGSVNASTTVASQLKKSTTGLFFIDT